MSYYIIGTAGHVDHGKTQLIKGLTGEDTDRLKEEKERGISIELGFASLTLPSGAKAGVVDVPGHEKFVKQMLAGVGGIDLVLLVIAADEGVMPQTKEHLEIIDLLQIRKGIVVLNKVDLVDAEWCELIKADIAEVLAGTVLENARVIAVSAKTGEGVDDLKQQIDRELSSLAPRNSGGPCRLPIDRAFSLPGFGTIVTGTMFRGSLKVGDSVVLEPGGLESRVRSLQVHGRSVSTAYAGQRVAVNLPDLEVAQIPKGPTLLSLGYLTPVKVLDIYLRTTSTAPKPLTQRQRVRFHIGAQEVFGRIHLLEREELEPGDGTYGQILLEESVIASRSDRFVIRQYSPARTIGGGHVVEAGNRKHKRYKQEVYEQLVLKDKGTPGELVLAKLQEATQPLPSGEVARLIGIGETEVHNALDSLGSEVKTCDLDGKAYWFTCSYVNRLGNEIKDILMDFHRKFPLRPGIPKEELKSKVFSSWSSKLFTAFLTTLDDQGILNTGNSVFLTGFQPKPQGKMAPIAIQISKDYTDAGLTPPDWQTVVEKYKLEKTDAEELLQYFLRQGSLVKTPPNFYFAQGSLQAAKEQVISLLSEKGEITPSDVKDSLGTSRKFLIPILEYFDAQKITRRVGDKRIKF